MRRAPLRNERRRQVDALAQRKSGHRRALLLPRAGRVARVRGRVELRVASTARTVRPRRFAEKFRLHGPFVDNTFKVRHIDTCRKQCTGCGAKRIKITADLSVLRRHWTDRVLAQYKGGVFYAMRKTMWNCLGQWARSQDVEDWDLTVNVGLDGRYCVRAGGRANETYA